MTRILNLWVHEEMYPHMREVAEDKHDGNLSEMIRLILYEYVARNRPESMIALKQVLDS